MTNNLPFFLSGPMLRNVTSQQFCLWLVTSEPVEFSLSLYNQDNHLVEQLKLTEQQCTRVPIGRHAVIHLIQVNWSKALESEPVWHYDLEFKANGGHQSLVKMLPELLYPGQAFLSFKVPGNIKKILHGSCRKPHHPDRDGLTQVDSILERSLNNSTNNSTTENATRPDLLLLTGDQVYVDDVAGPMLVAIHQVIRLLGLYDEQWQGAEVSNNEELIVHKYCYYERDKLLPFDSRDESLYQLFIAGKRKPIFTSANAKNHLVSLAEVFAMYLLIWSPRLWNLVDLTLPKSAVKYAEQYQSELEVIIDFSKDLPLVERALTQIPTYMIFDDHDVTDDWNLNRRWEEVAYGHPYSKRIIGNALIGYWLCQGWGNDPDSLIDLNRHLPEHFSKNKAVFEHHNQLIERLLHWSHWHYSIDTNPSILVLDTRTQRWRSETNPDRPSGLMDWESLSDLQQALVGKKAVFLVSAAPIFGVKLIESIQRIFTFIGKPLMVDAENWMAHRGTASVILNIFRTPITPPRFVILSGDVHYSFVYDVRLRFRRELRHIVQITSSGIKNKFPDKLLAWMDRFNQLLYASRSPLNFFTKRRSMAIKSRPPILLSEQEFLNEKSLNGNLRSDKALNGKIPNGRTLKGRTLLNKSGIGVVEFDSECKQVNASLVDSSGLHYSFSRQIKD